MEDNQLLTRVGPGTPMGNLFRRYWHAVGSTDEMSRHPTKAVRLLGESLILFRDAGGRLGLVQSRCPHRGASLLFGVPDDPGLRCAYHGWRFAPDGRCTDMPGNPPGAAEKRCIQITAYPVEVMGGLVFAYLGPLPAPTLPPWDFLLSQGYPKEIASIDVPCNWLQIMENNLDNHVRWLHIRFHNFARQASGAGPPAELEDERGNAGAIPNLLGSLGKETDYGFLWQMPFIFPSSLVTGQGRLPCLQLRVPIDDGNTRQYFYSGYHLGPAMLDVLRAHFDAAALDGTRVPHHSIATPPTPGLFPDYASMTNNIMQDALVVASQGAIHDRTDENLGTADRGIAHYRKLLRRELEKVQRGEDPLGVIRGRPAGDFLVMPRLGAFRASEPRALRARPGERPLENVQWWSPMLTRLVEAGHDVNRLKFEEP